MRKLVLYATALLSVFACSSENKSQSVEQEQIDSNAVVIAVLPTMDCLPLLVAQQHDLYDSCGVKVRLCEFNAQMDADTAFVGGSVDGMFTDIVRTEVLRGRGVDVVPLLSTELSWQLVANRALRIRRVNQFAEKMVAMTRYSATDMLTIHMFEGVKLKSPMFDVQINDLNVRLSMVLGGQMDAAWLPEPQATIARMDGNNVVADSTKTSWRLGVLAFNDKTLKKNKRDQYLDKLKMVYNRACDSIGKNGITAYESLLCNYYKIDTAVVSNLPDIVYHHASLPDEERKAQVQQYIKKMRK